MACVYVCVACVACVFHVCACVRGVWCARVRACVVCAVCECACVRVLESVCLRSYACTYCPILYGVCAWFVCVA